MNRAIVQLSNLVIRGPPRQATGPAGSGARVGIGILRGLVVSWESRISKEMISQKYKESARCKKMVFRTYQDSTRILKSQKLWINGRYFFKIMFDSFGVAYVLYFVKMMGLPKLFNDEVN